MSVADNLARIRKTIGAAPVKLVAVSKNVAPAAIEQAFDCGVTEFGESRVQDALAKRSLLKIKNANWHFIGHLQTNKVKQVVGHFALIHSIDSMHLAAAVSKTAVDQNMVQSVLLQVKIVPDISKSGFDPEELKSKFVELNQLPGIKIEGLMTIAPLTSDRIIWRQCFTGLKSLRDELEKDYGVVLKELSMGMSQDWQEAISCGATMVRLGRAIFAA